MGNRLVLNASLIYGKCVLCGVPGKGGTDTGVVKMAAAQDPHA